MAVKVDYAHHRKEGHPMGLRVKQKMDSGKGTKDDLKELKELADYIDISFCALGKGYGFTIRSALKNFKKEFDKRCM